MPPGLSNDLVEQLIIMNHYLEYFYRYSALLAGLLCAVVIAAIWRG